MDKVLIDYLENMDRYLKPMSVPERMDIINEIRGEMSELEREGVTPCEIVKRFGSAKELARAYLGESLARERGISTKKFMILFAYYSLVGFSGMILLPSLGTIAVVFVLTGVAIPIITAVDVVNYSFGLNIPFMDNVGIFIGDGVALNPYISFVLCVFLGGLLIFGGILSWKLMIIYCKKVSGSTKKVAEL